MRPGTWRGMEAARHITFAEALACLQAMLEKKVNITFNDDLTFAGCGFSGVLLRVETLPPDNSAVRLVLSEGGGLFLDPADMTAIASGPSSRPVSLEFTGGPIITVELCDEGDP